MFNENMLSVVLVSLNDVFTVLDFCSVRSYYQVRKAGQEALLILLEQDLVAQSDIENKVCPILLDLSAPDSDDEYKVEAVNVSEFEKLNLKESLYLYLLGFLLLLFSIFQQCYYKAFLEYNNFVQALNKHKKGEIKIVLTLVFA